LATDAELNRTLTRRSFFTRTSAGLGSTALASLLCPALLSPANAGESTSLARGNGPALPHFAPKAKRVIYLFMSGGPSHIDLFDPKPKLGELHGQEMPASVRGAQRVTLMTRNQGQFLVAAPQFKFVKYGQSGQEMTELFPHIGKIADDIAIIRSMHTEPINHDPAVNFIQTGSGVVGRPTLGSWLSYGLGSENTNLPEFIVLLSGTGGQPVVSRYWSNGFLPARYQGVQFRSQGDAVLYLSNPPGIDQATRKSLIDGVNELNRLKFDSLADPEIQARINSFELAYRMQMSVPELMDISSEPKAVLEKYGAQPGQASFAGNCVLARRLAERGVRFIQLYHRDWDHHVDLPSRMRQQCPQTDQASAALVQDLKDRGMLDDTLVIWGGEFGRTTFNQGALKKDSYGRDHHPRCYSLWMAGGGIKGGISFGKTDEFGYNIVEDGVHVHDFQATILYLLGIDHEKLTYRFQGRDFRLTDIEGHVVHQLLA
jgi:hypothetical protein